MKFKPMLAIDATKYLNSIKYPKLASYKLDGIRCDFHPELEMVTRSLKIIPNKQLREKFENLIAYSKTNNIILDGELYSHELTFQEITRAVMTHDFTSEKRKKKLMKKLLKETDEEYSKYVENLLSKIKFHCFELIDLNINFSDFQIRCTMIKALNLDNLIPVKQTIVNSAEEVNELFVKVLADGYEGLILRELDSPYKMGRSTLKEEWMLKVKPFETFDAKIIGVQQATEVDPNAEKTINELGRSVTSKKKGDRILIEKASAFVVEYNEHIVKPVLAMTDEEKKEIWANKESYIGRMIEYKGMQVGAKDVPRHPVFVRFRKDRD